MFSYIAEVPLSEYIRRRRITLAAFDLQSKDEKVIDIALKYGCESPTAFNRAFRNIHGIPPSAARKQRTSLKAFPRISFKMIIKGEVEMNYRIEKKDSFKIVGVKEHYVMNVEECFEKVPQFWQKTIQSGFIPEILTQISREPFGLFLFSNQTSRLFKKFIQYSRTGITGGDIFFGNLSISNHCKSVVSFV